MHSIVHQEALFTKSDIFSDVMSVMIIVVNTISFCSFNHHQFQLLIDEVKMQYSCSLHQDLLADSWSNTVPCVSPAAGDCHHFPFNKFLHADHFSHSQWLAHLALRVTYIHT